MFFTLGKVNVSYAWAMPSVGLQALLYNCLHRKWLNSDPCLISYFFLSTFWSKKTKPCSPSLGHTECCCSIAKFPHRTLCALPSSLFYKFWWRFTCLGLFSFKISFKTVSTLRNVSDVETLSANRRSGTSFPSCQEARVKVQLLGEDRAGCAFCCCGTLILSETFTNSPQEPWLLVLTCNPMLLLHFVCGKREVVTQQKELWIWPYLLKNKRVGVTRIMYSSFNVCGLPQDAQPECPGKTRAGPNLWCLCGNEKFASIWIVFQAEMAIAFGLRGCWFFQHVYKEFYSSSKVLEGAGSYFLLDLQISCLELMWLYM